jgi:type I restriction enzyme S subunit
VCTVFGDGDWIESKDQSPEGVRLVQTGNVGEGEFKDRAEKARFISQDTFTRLRCTEIFAGDCLISRLPDPVGRACLIPETGERMITAVDCTVVRFDQNKLLPEFFAYYSQAGDYLAAVEREATGTTRKRISRARLGQIPVPLAPLSEQRRIVAILDEAFEGIATAKANAEKNLQNARQLLAGFLGQRFSGEDKSWPMKALRDLCVVDWGNTNLTKSAYVEDGAFLAVSAAGCDGRIGHREHSAYTPVLSAIGAQCGRMFLPAEDFTAIKNTITLTPRQGVCRGPFLYRLFTAVELPRRGAAQPFIAKGDIQAFTVQVPNSLDEQDDIVDAIDALEVETERLAALLKRKLAVLDELKKSLLRRAFDGLL